MMDIEGALTRSRRGGLLPSFLPLPSYSFLLPFPSFNKYLLSGCYVPGTVLGAGRQNGSYNTM